MESQKFEGATRRLAEYFSKEQFKAREKEFFEGDYGVAGAGGPSQGISQETPLRQEHKPVASMVYASGANYGPLNSIYTPTTLGSRSNLRGDEAPPFVVTAQDISPQDKLAKVTLQGVKWILMDKYPQYKVNCVGPPKRLIHFMSLPVKNDMLLEQRRRGTAWSQIHNLDSMMEAPDEQVVLMLAHCLMPSSFGTYREELWRFMTKIPPDKGDIPRHGEKQLEKQLSVDGFNNRFHSTVDRMLNELVLFDNFFRLNCQDEKERNDLPKLMYGRHSDQQAFNFFLGAFAPYTASFKCLLTESAIGECKTLHDFVELFRENATTSRVRTGRTGERMTRCSPGRRMKIFRRGWPERICRNSSETERQIASCMATPMARGVTNAIGTSSPEIISDQIGAPTTRHLNVLEATSEF
jgi:hypothetical protein